jgi:hypothetical protein
MTYQIEFVKKAAKQFLTPQYPVNYGYTIPQPPDLQLTICVANSPETKPKNVSIWLRQF